MQEVEDILERQLYSALCTFSGQLLSPKKFSMCNLVRIIDNMTTFQIYRFFTFVIKPMFPYSLCPNTLLKKVYSKRCGDKFHIFYLVVLLCIIYFKNTNTKTSSKICRLLRFIQRIAKSKEPFQHLYISFEKYKTNVLSINRHTKIPISYFKFTQEHAVSPEFARMRKILQQARNTEWLPNKKSFHALKAACNFAYKYYTSNRILKSPDVKTLKTELFYPKHWMDFAYYFKQKAIDIPQSRRKCFATLKKVIASPIVTNNLSFSHYLLNFLTFFVNFMNNKVVTMNKPACFCNTKCIRKEGQLEKLYNAGLFILCKTCNCPVNYHQKIYSKVNVINDFNHPNRYFSCSDYCSQFHITDIYKCCLTESGEIQFHYKGLLSVRGKQKYLTSICLENRTCTNLFTKTVDKGMNNYVCSSNHKYEDTCFDLFKQLQFESEEVLNKNFVLNNMCVGCLVFCFDYCSRRDKYKVLVRKILQKK